ncbi:putative permease [Granulicella aggregans]|uniref:Putative permease n=1 Tax=Granulicella aggregans TaxID=474949 RepID=A0A7W7ZFE6_9BACT|nr:ABC transporter permease [Granulicella aggregans]MBB5058812.1 putative permease [Granulicella aggregans]
MRLLRSALRRVHSLFQKDASNIELGEELRFHLESLIERNIARGMSPELARITAKAEFGSTSQAIEATYESRGTALVEDLAQDVRYGFRSLRRQPAFTFATVLMLALGIGACTAIFSLVNAVLLRSLPYGDSSRLVYLFTPNPDIKGLPGPEVFGPSDADFFDIRAASRSYDSITFFNQKIYSLNAGDQAQRVGAAKIDSSFFHTLEVEPIIGSDFKAQDEEPGSNHVVIIGYPLWQSLFAGAANILDRSITLDEQTYKIVGVMPKDFGYPHKSELAYGNGSIETTQIWIPSSLTPQEKADRDQSSANALARLKPSVTPQEAQSELKSVMARLNRLHHGEFAEGWTGMVKSFPEYVLGPVRPLMFLLLGTVGFVLLIACGNAANLLLARAANRQHELGVRAALGARRGRILRQMLTESLLLGCSAGLVGVGLAYLFVQGLLKLNPGNIPHMASTSLDLRALSFAVLISLITSFAFGILPSISASRINLTEVVSSAGARGLVASRRRLRSTLVTAQVAIVVILLVGAGLFLRSYMNLLSVQTGFSPSTIAVNVAVTPRYETPQKLQAFYTTLLERVEIQHGIDSVGLVNFLPLTDSESLTTLTVDGDLGVDHPLVEERAITSGYLPAMQTPLIRGRNFTPDEDFPAPHPVVIVNETFAKRFFAGKDAIGQHVRKAAAAPWSTVVGVAQDIRNEGLETVAVPQIYDPFFDGNQPPNGVYLALGSTLPNETVLKTVHAVLRSIDPGIALSDVHVMSDLATQSTAPRRFQTMVLTLFSAIALFLAVAGVYGLLAYSVRQRTSEIGLRMALGSTRIGIARLILREGLSLLITGLCIGMAVAIGSARLVRSFLYEVPALDPVTFVIVPALLLVSTVAACLIPTVRAASTDPMAALRHE